MKSTVKIAKKTMKFGLGAVACALLLSTLSAGPAWASQGTPPPGWIFQLAPPGPQSGPLTGYQQFTTSFLATSTTTDVSFAFREVPRFFAFDDASVKLDPASGGTGRSCCRTRVLRARPLVRQPRLAGINGVSLRRPPLPA